MAYTAMGQALFDPNLVQAPPASSSGGGTASGWQVATTQAGYTEAQKAAFAKAMATELAKKQATAQLQAQAVVALGKFKCVTQAEHDRAVTDCRLASLRGLGNALGVWSYPEGKFAGFDPCIIAEIPLCSAPPRLREKAPAKAPPVLRQKTTAQAPPTLRTKQQTTMTAAEAKGGLGVGSILLLLVAGGTGYYLYRRYSKKGTAAAA